MLFERDFADHVGAPGIRSTLRHLLYRMAAILYQSGNAAATMRQDWG
jgi:hypothetical protein